jgi:transposase
MPQRQLTNTERGVIIGHYFKGATQTQIAATMKKPHETIQDMIQGYCTNRQIAKTPQSGQPKKLSECNEQTLVCKSRLSTEQHQQPLAKIQSSFPNTNAALFPFKGT